MIFTARQLQEKCQEQNVDLYMTFVDLTKAFDTVSRDGLWKIKFGCPPRYLAMAHNFMMACRHVCKMMESSLNVLGNEWGHTGLCYGTNTVQHSVFYHARGCCQDIDAGFPIRNRFDDNVFNLRRLQTKTKMQTDVLHELLYADDKDKNASSEAKSHSHVITMISQSAQKDRGLSAPANVDWPCYKNA